VIKVEPLKNAANTSLLAQTSATGLMKTTFGSNNISLIPKRFDTKQLDDSSVMLKLSFHCNSEIWKSRTDPAHIWVVAQIPHRPDLDTPAVLNVSFSHAAAVV